MDNPWEDARRHEDDERSTKIKQELIQAANESVKEVADKLTSLGFSVTRLDSSLMPLFNLQVVRGNSMYLVDVMRRSAFASDYWIAKKQLELWKEEYTAATKIVAFNIKNTSCRYILVGNIEQVAIDKRGKGSLHIRFEDTKPLDLLP